MYKLVGVTRAKAGKVREAVAAIKGIAEYVKSKHDIKTDVHVQLFGPAGTIYLIAEHQDVAAIQAIQSKMMGDDGYWSLVQKAAEVSEPPTIALLQSV